MDSPTTTEPSLTDELRAARRLARAAGASAMRFYGSARATAKTDGSPVTAADHASNRIIVEGLREAFPDDAILSEESRDSRARLGHDRVWIVDPLDGTKEFLSQNGEFAIMIGLAIHGEPVLGVVYLPDGNVLYSAARGEGAWAERSGGQRTELRREARGGSEDRAWNGRRPRLVGSRSHSDPLLGRIRDELGITETRPCGSVGVKCALVATDECDLYIHPVPYLSEWDTCAPEVLIREAGGSVTDCRGEPLRYNKPDPVQPHGIFVYAPGNADAVLERVVPLYTEHLERSSTTLPTT